MRNSTIIIKSKPCKSCGRVLPVFSRGRCAQCAKVEDFASRLEKDNEKVIQEEDLSGLIEDADTIFSRFIRLKYANENGMVKCFTCLIEKHWSLMQNGHYIKRAHLYLRWDERNCRPQCSNCNEILHGNMAVYTQRLEREQPGITDILKEEMRIVHKVSRDEIRQVISEYTPKVKAMLSRIEKHQSLE